MVTKKSIIKGVFGYLLCLCVVVSVEFIYSKYSPREWWFHYEEVLPTKSSFHETEIPSFTSVAEFYRDAKILYNDYPICIEDGLLIRYDGDIVQKNISSGSSFKCDDKAWDYDEQSFKNTTEKCKMHGVITAITPYGHEKIQEYETRWFDITHDK